MNELNDLDIILQDALKLVTSVTSINELDLTKTSTLGKSGKINALMQNLKNISNNDKKTYGAKINHLKTTIENAFLSRREELSSYALTKKITEETIDVTLDGNHNKLGSLHPVSITLNRMLNIFGQMGFDIADGPEIETDYYNFKALNIPDNHPARAMQDTFYTENNNVLRTHTSPIQIRYTENKTPPIKVIAPGRVYRVDMDATHSPMFHQLEGLWIDKNISFANLKGVIVEFLRKFFNKEDLQIRFRASFFPFTEPSAEVDILSNDNKWLEVLGCGMVHPEVLKNMNIDVNEYNGFAFGMGIDRFTMLRYDIQDLRLMFENDIDFLNQFSGKNEVDI